jgi:biotin carboxyl carrier protein
MKFDVTVNGRPWRVAVEPAEQRGVVRVSVKGRRRLFDASWIDDRTLSLIHVDTDEERSESGGQGRVHDIGIVPGGTDEVDLVVGGKTFHVLAVAEGKPSQRVRTPQALVTVEGRQTILAPMPGRIVRVLVAAGDRVTTDQAVVVVEAMKMENELRSPKDGVVREVAIRVGDAVEARAVLVVIE